MKKNIKNSYRHTYLKYKNLVASFYFPQKMSEMIIIIAKGALSAGDLGKEKPYEKIAKLNIPIIIPDYYGHFRSEGIFTPENCAKTIIETMRLAQGKIKAYDVKNKKNISFNFKNVIVIGSSFGGWISWYINNFFPNYAIKKIGLIAPLIDFKNQASAKFPQEENLEQFLFTGKILFKNVYRGIEKPIWKFFLSGKDKKFDPMQNLNSFANCEVAIVHGKKDGIINYSKSQNLYSKLKEINPQNKSIRLLKNIGHTSDQFEEKIKIVVEQLLQK